MLRPGLAAAVLIASLAACEAGGTEEPAAPEAAGTAAAEGTVVSQSVPDRPIDGTVVAISPEAEFTPRIALTERERADLVFGVKVALTDTTGLLRPGLPASVELEPPADR